MCFWCPSLTHVFLSTQYLSPPSLASFSRSYNLTPVQYLVSLGAFTSFLALAGFRPGMPQPVVELGAEQISNCPGTAGRWGGSRRWYLSGQSPLQLLPTCYLMANWRCFRNPKGQEDMVLSGLASALPSSLGSWYLWVRALLSVRLVSGFRHSQSSDATRTIDARPHLPHPSPAEPRKERSTHTAPA